MNDLITKIINGIEIEEIMSNIISDLYKNGPINSDYLEALCYLQVYQTNKFLKYKDKIINYMGLSFKNNNYNSMNEIIFKIYDECIQDKYKEKFTPIQANIINYINKYDCFSFSAPTSTGKSFVFQNIVNNVINDVVIIVPSRALINEYYNNLNSLIRNKRVNILTFIDKINTKKSDKNIFIVTPERCKELFKIKDEFNVDIFIFDEAQLCDEESSRGLYFDSIIRRAKRYFPKAKYVFSHPFVDNPEVQITKNKFNNDKSKQMSYKYRNVGQMYYSHIDNEYYHFGINKELMGRNKIKANFDPIEKTLRNNGSVLIYTTKASIYSKNVLKEFEKYINMCKEIKDPAIDYYVNGIKSYIGASDKKNDEQYSQMVDLMKKGIVLHHGSMPLQTRLLLEEYTRKGYCRICFATSTLEQGINMPFDIVYLNTFTSSESLSLKNIIGRAGRSTTENKFDFGSVIVKSNNMSDLRRIINGKEELDDKSMLDKDVDDDLKEFKEAINNESFIDEYNMTEKQRDRLTTTSANEIIISLINLIFDGNKLIKNYEKETRIRIIDCFVQLYENYLSRPLNKGEKNVVETAITIILWQIDSKSFKDICFYRYAHASRKQKRDSIKKLIKNGINKEENEKNYDNLKAKFITGYHELPNKNLRVYSLFDDGTKACNVDYDKIVFDTYDYLDKCIGFILSDIYYAAFIEHNKRSHDERALRLAKLIKYRTEDEKTIWMLRYGFSFEDIEWIKPCIQEINQEQIVFNNNINTLSKEQIKIIERYL